MRFKNLSLFPSSSHLESADAWFTPGRFAALLALLIFIFFPDVILGTRTFIFRDFGAFGYPIAFYHRQSFWRGEVPLLNPLNNCGLPFLAQWNTIVLYPGSLFYLLFPLSWSLGVFCLVHLFLAGLGMYFLAHRWTGNRLAASVAGLAFAFNGFTLSCLIWPHCMASLGWMPFVVLTAESAWQKGGRFVVAAAVIGALQMLAGPPEFILSTWLVVGSLWLGHCAFGKLPVWDSLKRMGFVVLTITALSGAQLFPFFELLEHSQRGSSYGTGEWSMPPTGWANLLVPLLYCFKTPAGPYVQHDQYMVSSYYLGVSVLALALFAVCQLREWRVWLLGGIAALSLILALGNAGYLFGWLRRILPLLGFMRFPVKFVMLTAFTVPLLAACGARVAVFDIAADDGPKLAVFGCSMADDDQPGFSHSLVCARLSGRCGTLGRYRSKRFGAGGISIADSGGALPPQPCPRCAQTSRPGRWIAGAAVAGCCDSRPSTESHGPALRLRAGAATGAAVEAPTDLGRIQSSLEF